MRCEAAVAAVSTFCVCTVQQGHLDVCLNKEISHIWQIEVSEHLTALGFLR